MDAKPLMIALGLALLVALGLYAFVANRPPSPAVSGAEAVAEMRLVNDYTAPVTFTHLPDPASAPGGADPTGPDLVPGFVRLAPGDSSGSTHTERGPMTGAAFEFVVTAWAPDEGPVEARFPAGSWVVRFHEAADGGGLAVTVTEAPAGG